MGSQPVPRFALRSLRLIGGWMLAFGRWRSKICGRSRNDAKENTRKVRKGIL